MELPPPAHDPGAVRDLADRILSESRYDRPPKSIPDRILEWFGEQLGRVLGSFVGSGAGTLVAWALVVAAVGFVIYLVVRYGRLGRLPRALERSPSVMVELTRTRGRVARRRGPAGSAGSVEGGAAVPPPGPHRRPRPPRRHPRASRPDGTGVRA